MIVTKLIDMPCTVKALLYKSDIDCYTIILNSQLTVEALHKSYIHELEHIKHYDSYNINSNVDNIEYITRMLSIHAN